MHTPQIGSIVGGKYRLVRPLGEGGMGTVFEVEHTVTQKRAAIKWLHPHFAAHEQGYQRVVNEARAAARIRHENVVDVYDVIREGDGILLVMELLIGEPLSARLARETLLVHELVELLLPALRGLAAAHAVGVIHRDIKPDNIFLARERNYEEVTPKIIDFGISKVFDAESGHVTGSGIAMGTPKYVSYEQLMGARDVDARTDVYAFGVILYEALAGAAPYGETSNLAEQAIRFVTVTPLAPRALRPEIPEQLDRLVTACVARDRDERLADIDELARQLEPFADKARYAAPLTAFGPARLRDPAAALPTKATKPTPSALRLLRAKNEVAVTRSAESGREEPPTALARRSVPVTTQRARALSVGGAAVVLAALLALLADRTEVAEPREAPSARARSSAAPKLGSSQAPVVAEAPPLAHDVHVTAEDGGVPPSVATTELEHERGGAAAAATALKRRAKTRAGVAADAGMEQSNASATAGVMARDAGPNESASMLSDAAHPEREESDAQHPDATRHRAGPVRRQEF